jgi:hypothetical protein
MTDITIPKSYTIPDRQDRARILGQVYRLLFELARERTADRGEAGNQARSAASETAATGPQHQTHHNTAGSHSQENPMTAESGSHAEMGEDSYHVKPSIQPRTEVDHGR